MNTIVKILEDIVWDELVIAHQVAIAVFVGENNQGEIQVVLNEKNIYVHQLPKTDMGSVDYYPWMYTHNTYGNGATFI